MSENSEVVIIYPDLLSSQSGSSSQIKWQNVAKCGQKPYHTQMLLHFAAEFLQNLSPFSRWTLVFGAPGIMLAPPISASLMSEFCPANGWSKAARRRAVCPTPKDPQSHGENPPNSIGDTGKSHQTLRDLWKWRVMILKIRRIHVNPKSWNVMDISVS